MIYLRLASLVRLKGARKHKQVKLQINSIRLTKNMA